VLADQPAPDAAARARRFFLCAGQRLQGQADGGVDQLGQRAVQIGVGAQRAAEQRLQLGGAGEALVVEVLDQAAPVGRAAAQPEAAGPGPDVQRRLGLGQAGHAAEGAAAVHRDDGGQLDAAGRAEDLDRARAGIDAQGGAAVIVGFRHVHPPEWLVWVVCGAWRTAGVERKGAEGCARGKRVSGLTWV